MVNVHGNGEKGMSHKTTPTVGKHCGTFYVAKFEFKNCDVECLHSVCLLLSLMGICFFAITMDVYYFYQELSE